MIKEFTRQEEEDDEDDNRTGEDRPPFFIFTAWGPPHEPYVPHPKYRNACRDMTIPRILNWNIGSEDKQWMV